jgi:hypothetical protein
MRSHARTRPISAPNVGAKPPRSGVFCDPKVEVRLLSKLRRHPCALQLCPTRDLPGLAQVIRRFGLLTPLIIDSRDRIVGPLHHYEGAKLAGLKNVPVVRHSRLSAREKRALATSKRGARDLCAWWGRPHGFRSTAPL